MTDQGNMRFPWYMKLFYGLMILLSPLRWLTALLGRRRRS